jgi:hypothetical protein
MNQLCVGKFKHKYKDHALDLLGTEDTSGGFLIKHDGVIMLLTRAYDTPFSGSFLLNNGTKLKINCSKRNRLYLAGYGVYIFGVSEHLDKIGDAGF